MKKILEYILQAEGITNTRLAAMLEVAPASITHIMSGRNKPSYDFLVKLVETFPQYDARWILTGKGEPKCITNASVEAQHATVGEPQLFSLGEVAEHHDNAKPSLKTSAFATNALGQTGGESSIIPSDTPRTRLIVCFPDHTFVEYESRH